MKVDSSAKERIKEFVSRPVAKCSEEATDNFESESEESLNILVNMVSILPAEYDCLTEVEDSADVDAEEMALHKPTCYFVMNNGSIENQDAFFERPDMAMRSHLKPLLIRAKLEGVAINKVLVDCGATVNIMPHHLLHKIGKYDTDVKSHNVVLSDYEGRTRNTME